MVRILPVAFVSLILSLASGVSFAATWNVGPTRTYTMPSQVSTLVGNGDTVLIDAGTYQSDVARWQADNLVLRGFNGMARLESNGLSYGDKAIWVIAGNNTTVGYVEFFECTSTSNNGAGIRQEGQDLTIRNCYFHDNENGILAGTVAGSTILIEYTEFGYNGYGDGQSHNLYINNIDSLIFRYNYSHHAIIGHELKSRAHVSLVLYNRISDETAGTASRSIDLPNGGTVIIIGNVIEQGPNSPNGNIIGYGLEGLINPTAHELYVVNNTIVNNRSSGTYVHVQNGTAFYKSCNNILAGPGTLLSGTPTTQDVQNNYVVPVIPNAGFMNASAYDFRLTGSSTGAIDQGISPGFAGSYSLTPVLVYQHPASQMLRLINGALDAGAYEFGTASVSDFDNSVLNVYPNPAINEIHLVSEKNIPIRIFTSSGKRIAEFPNADIIDVSFLSPGSYIISTGTKFFKFVKQ